MLAQGIYILIFSIPDEGWKFVADQVIAAFERAGFDQLRYIVFLDNDVPVDFAHIQRNRHAAAQLILVAVVGSLRFGQWQRIANSSLHAVLKINLVPKSSHR